MTLVVGIKCGADGVVVGADGAATLGTVLGKPTVIQHVAKLNLIANRIIVGFSGPIGLGQLYVDRIEKLWQDKQVGGIGVKPAEVGRSLRDALLKDAEVAIRGAAMSIPILGGAAQLGALTSTLVALPVERKPALYELNHQGTPEEKTRDLPYVAIGSGQLIADPFMSFLSRVFWPKSFPNLARGIFATVWTLRHAIKVSPGGVSDPIGIAVLTYKGQELEARQLEEGELSEAEQDIREAEDYLRRFQQAGGLPTGSAPPQPPSSP